MDLRLLDQSPEMAPILVRLYESQKLYGLASDESPAARAELTGAIAELLERDLPVRERELISDLLINLMRQAEKDLRQALADRLSVMEHAPLRIILHIANDEISIARPVLRNSPVLSDLDLMYIIKAKGTSYWQEIAGRSELSEALVNMLAETRDVLTNKKLAENQSLHITEKAFNIMGSMAQYDETLARPLLMRPDVPEIVARHLYEYVGQELRSHIQSTFGVHSEAASKALDDLMIEFAEGARAQFMPTTTMLLTADAMAQSGRLTMTPIMDSLQRGQFASFVAMFSKYCGMNPQMVLDMVNDSSGTNLAVTCRALGLSKADLSRIYMMTQRIRSADRIVDHTELLQALAVYDKVSIGKAQSLLHIHPK